MERLKRKLTFWDGASLIVANVIGIGIFTTPGIVAGMVPGTGSFLLVWLLGGAFALIGAMAYAELASHIPEAGGEYIYLREAFGTFWGFLSGWTSFIAGFPGAIAAASIGFAAYLKNILSPEAVEWISSDAFGMDIPFQTTIAITVIIVLTVVHMLKISISKGVQNILTLLTIATILLLIGIGFYGDSTGTIGSHSLTLAAPQHWLMAMIPVLFTFSGWNAAVYVAEEIREPEKNMRRAMILGTSVVVVLYVLLNVVYIKAASIEVLSGTVEVTSLLSERLLSFSGHLLVGIVILTALVSSISAMIVTGPRVYFAMARDGVFPKFLCRVSPSDKTPYGAIFTQSAWSIILVISGTFGELLTYTGFAIVLFSTLAVVALLTIKKDALLTDRFKSGLYLIFVLAGLAMTLNAIIQSPWPSLSGVGMIAMGAPVFLWFKKYGWQISDDG